MKAAGEFPGSNGTFSHWEGVTARAEWVEKPNARRKGLSGVVKRICLQSADYYTSRARPTTSTTR